MAAVRARAEILRRAPVMGDLDEPSGARDAGAGRSAARSPGHRRRAGRGVPTAGARRRRPPAPAHVGIGSVRRTRPGSTNRSWAAIALRSASPMSASDNPQTSARSSCSTCRPATAAISTSRPAASEPAARRTWRTPRSVSGRRSRLRPGSSAAAASSSAKNAFPSERRTIESTRAAARWRAGDPCQQFDEFVTLEPLRGRFARRVAGARSRPAMPSADGGGAARRSGMSRSSAVARLGRCASGRRAGRGWIDRPSGGPRSRAGPGRLAEPAEQPEGALRRCGSGAIPSGPPPAATPPTVATSGTRRASSGRLGPAASAIRSGSTWRTSERRASTIGPNGSPSSPRATAPPSMTSQSFARSRATASSTRRLLPTPGLTADEDERRLARGSRIGRREEFLQLPRAADEDRAAQAPSHVFHHRARYRPGRRPSAPKEGRRPVQGQALAAPVS